MDTCYSAIERNRVLTHATALENIEQSEIIQTQHDKYGIFHSYEISGIAKSIETGSRLEVTRGWREC